MSIKVVRLADAHRSELYDLLLAENWTQLAKELEQNGLQVFTQYVALVEGHVAGWLEGTLRYETDTEMPGYPTPWAQVNYVLTCASLAGKESRATCCAASLATKARQGAASWCSGQRGDATIPAAGSHSSLRTVSDRFLVPNYSASVLIGFSPAQPSRAAWCERSVPGRRQPRAGQRLAVWARSASAQTTAGRVPGRRTRSGRDPGQGVLRGVACPLPDRRQRTGPRP
ncbi:hypothetical protein ACIQMR_31385 [Streptomyces sp. NPDC091376]|uniref:hypothetical protein n=1 Tax=Streptomyces sp. NPDC091376 TaxID=3365994 RepID=UPI0038062803